MLIIALAETCAVFDALLDLEVMAEVRPRILELASMDLIAHAMKDVLVSVQRAMSEGSVANVQIYGRTSDRAQIQ